MTISKKYKVKRIGWNNEHPVTPVILIDGSERTRLDLQQGDVVKVVRRISKSIDLQSMAYVQIQFKDLIGQEVASLNSKLAEILQVQIDDEVEISKELTEIEAERFKQNNQRQHFMSMGGD